MSSATDWSTLGGEHGSIGVQLPLHTQDSTAKDQHGPKVPASCFASRVNAAIFITTVVTSVRRRAAHEQT